MSLVSAIEKSASTGEGRGADAFRLMAQPLKIASLDDRVHESEEDARNRRIGELLRRREPSGLSSGSADPTPPKDTSP